MVGRRNNNRYKGTDEEYREKSFPFTLFASNDNGVLEVTWTEDTPNRM